MTNCVNAFGRKDNIDRANLDDIVNRKEIDNGN